MSLRSALLTLAIVPGLALAALWAVTTGETFVNFQRMAAQGQLAQQAGQPSNIVYYNLQEERRLSAESIAKPGSVTDKLREQRRKTDEAISTFQKLSDIATDDAPTEVRDAVVQARQAMGQLDSQRAAVDEGGSADRQATVYRYYTDLIAVDLRLFGALSHVDDGKVTTISQPLVALFWTKEMISRSDALLARGWPVGRLSVQDYQQVQQAVHEQPFRYGTEVVPYLKPAEAAMWQEIVSSPAWQAKTEVEQSLLKPTAADGAGTVPLAPNQQKWRQAMDQLTPKLVALMESRTSGVVEVGLGSITHLLLTVVLTSVIGLFAVIAVIVTTWRLTRSMRRRITELQEQAEQLERSLPEVVERLAQGEQIDLAAEAAAIEQEPQGTGDELARLGQALNLARASAIAAAVRQADQHRGFEKLLQRIARRTQLLIGQQLRKLDELERRHEDPEVLEGLFDLDHLTARLRRYEENLVILAGGTPHRRWRKPVPLLDVLRAAQGEVQDYTRVVLDLDGSPWLSERAVGPVAHVVAELVENALSFSPPPTPVEVRAGTVGRGLAIEVEDRGLGMDEEQLAAANDLMSRPPRLDVLARTEDIRLGFHVIARLAAQHGLRVEFRQSAFGGTRAILLLPDTLLVGPPGVHAVPDVTSAEVLPTRSRGEALARATAPELPRAVQSGQESYRPVAELPYGGPEPRQDGPYRPELYGDPFPQAGPFPQPDPFPTADPFPAALPFPAADPFPSAEHGYSGLPYQQQSRTPAEPEAEPPLPRRVRQASLVDELRLAPTESNTRPKPPRWDENPLLRPAPRRAGAAIGAFQRRSRAARENPAAPLDDSGQDLPTPTTEDRS
ncbi:MULTISPECIES: nitrate- and nitrite sensing domain-containing protein [unclassified Kitasatospora]|uniref:nitrate- and nitrite sensing domain-containing protein n=1 Tax=unclassified Kitasatospora TaxID=2633591 RepID=UPI0007C715F1|nr:MULTISPECIES: nitrate- and nitrite sensing domain-containing protein [unclassified Kitasatospora]